MLDTNKILT